MGKRGIPKGYKFKPEAETCRNMVWTRFTDEQIEIVEWLVDQFDVSYAQAVRLCVEIVGDMPLSIMHAAVSKKMWKK